MYETLSTDLGPTSRDLKLYCWTNKVCITAVFENSTWQIRIIYAKVPLQFLLHKSLLFPVGAKNITCIGITENLVVLGM